MRRLIAPTEDFIKIEAGALDADAIAGATVTLTLENNDGIAQNDYIVVGHEGSELCEMCQVDQAVVAGKSVRVAVLKFNHRKGEPVKKYQFNKRKFYGATSQGGSYTELTSDGSPKDIQVDDPQGTILEYTGSTYTWFKSTYYNSQTATETDVADSTAVQGDQSLRYASLWGIRKHAGLAGNTLYSDIRLEQKRVQAESEINSYLYARYTLPLTEVPGIITNICELLAAGYIDYEEYGQDGEGVKWLGSARGQLKSIQKGDLRLIAADGTELAIKTTSNGVRSYPNTVDNDNGPSRMFENDQVF